MTKLKQHLSLIYGLFGSILIVSSLMIVYRLIGFSRSDALYLACLTFAILAYFISRRTLRKFGRK